MLRDGFFTVFSRLINMLTGDVRGLLSPFGTSLRYLWLAVVNRGGWDLLAARRLLDQQLPNSVRSLDANRRI